MSSNTADYRINNSTFRVQYGDLTRLAADALVSSDDNYLSMGGGVSQALSQAGGENIRQEARKHIPLKLGDVAVTSAGILPAKFIFHAVTIDYDKIENANERTIESATKRCMDLAESLNVQHIAFPALGTGVARFPFQLAAEIMTETISSHLRGVTKIKLVTLTLFARERVTDANLNQFYERATAIAALAAQGRKMNDLFSELRQMIAPLKRPDLTRQMVELESQLTQSITVLSERPSTMDGLDEISTRSNIAALSEKVVYLSTRTQETGLWQERQAETMVLQTKFQGLQTLLNVHTATLYKLLEKKAKYGSVETPIYLENSIEDAEKDLEKCRNEAEEVRAQLIALGSSA